MKFEDYCPQHRQTLINYSLKLTRQMSASEDLVQDTMVRAFTYWPQFQPTTEDVSRDCLNWLRRIMTNIYYNQFHRAKKHAAGLKEYQDFLEEVPDQHAADRVEGLLDHLKPEHRRLIELHYVDGLSYVEVAKTLGIKATKVQKDLWRAREALKEKLTLVGVIDTPSLETIESPEPETDAINSVMGRDDGFDFLDA